MGSILGQGTKISHAAPAQQKRKEFRGTPSVVQWLGLNAFTAKDKELRFYKLHSMAINKLVSHFTFFPTIWTFQLNLSQCVPNNIHPTTLVLVILGVPKRKNSF